MRPRWLTAMPCLFAHARIWPPGRGTSPGAGALTELAGPVRDLAVTRERDPVTVPCSSEAGRTRQRHRLTILPAALVRRYVGAAQMAMKTRPLSPAQTCRADSGVTAMNCPGRTGTCWPSTTIVPVPCTMAYTSSARRRCGRAVRSFRRAEAQPGRARTRGHRVLARCCCGAGLRPDAVPGPVSARPHRLWCRSSGSLLKPAKRTLRAAAFPSWLLPRHRRRRPVLRAGFGERVMSQSYRVAGVM